MALEPLAKRGNYFHIYDFRVKPGRGDEFIRLFDAFDYSDENPMHKSSAQVKDGVLCRDVDDPDHFTSSFSVTRRFAYRGDLEATEGAAGVTEYSCEENNRNVPSADGVVTTEVRASR